MSAMMSFFQSGMVLIAFQISFFSSSVLTDPAKWSLPFSSCALPSNLPFAIEMAYAYLSRNPMLASSLRPVQTTFLRWWHESTSLAHDSQLGDRPVIDLVHTDLREPKVSGGGTRIEFERHRHVQRI